MEEQMTLARRVGTAKGLNPRERLALIDDLHDRICELEADNGFLSSLIATQDAKIAELNQKLSEGKAIIVDDMDKLSSRTKELMDWRDRANAAEAKLREMQPAPFTPFWPPALRAGERYRVLCDDKGRNGGTWLDVFLANDGDVHVSMQDWENVPDGKPDPWPSLRVRTYTGGGRNERTRQALLWLAEAIRLDTAPRPTMPESDK